MRQTINVGLELLLHSPTVIPKPTPSKTTVILPCIKTNCKTVGSNIDREAINLVVLSVWSLSPHHPFKPKLTEALVTYLTQTYLTMNIIIPKNFTHQLSPHVSLPDVLKTPFVSDQIVATHTELVAPTEGM